jgi:hypothetical protein
MTLIESTHSARPDRAPRLPIPRFAGLGERMAAESRHARLDDVLLALVVNALGPDGRVALGGAEWRSVEDAIRDPISAVARSAVEQLAVEIEAILADQVPELGRRLADHRLRTELGYD